MVQILAICCLVVVGWPTISQGMRPKIQREATPAGYSTVIEQQKIIEFNENYVPPAVIDGQNFSPRAQDGIRQFTSSKKYLPPTGFRDHGISPDFQNGLGRPASSQNYFTPAGFGGQGIASGFPNIFQPATAQRYLPPPGISGSGISPGFPNGFNQPAINQLGPQYLEVPSAMSYTDPKRNLSIQFTYTPINNFTEGFNLNFEIKNGEEESATLSFSSTAGKGGVTSGIQGLLTTVLEGINKSIFQYAGKTPADGGFVSTPSPIPVDNGSSKNLEEDKSQDSTGNLGMNDLPGGGDEGGPSCPDCPLAAKLDDTNTTSPITEQ